MSTPITKLNRSCSESDLDKIHFDNLCLQEPHNESEKRGYFITRKILFVEEVHHCDSPDIFRRATSHQTIGQSTPDHLNNLSTLAFANMVNNRYSHFLNDSVISGHSQCDTTMSTTSRKKNNEDDIIPMEIDTLNDKLESQDCIDFIETMDVDTNPENGGSTRRRLNDAIRERNLTKSHEFTNILNSCLPEESFEKNRTKITSIAQFKNSNLKNTCILLALIMFLLFLLYIVFFYDNLYVNSDVQCFHIEKDLTEKVHGQNKSTQVIVRTFQKREKWYNKIKVLSFVGSTGVGKTFVANLIKKHFFPQLVHEMFGTHLNYERLTNQVLTAIRRCCLNLIVIDDLKRQDITELLAFIHTLPEDHFILVLSIFNIQYTHDKIHHKINYTDIVEIRNEFDKSGLHHELIIFDEFNDVHVRDWTIRQLSLQNVAKKIQGQVLESVLKGHDAKYNGLKGLYSKLLLEIEKRVH